MADVDMKGLKALQIAAAGTMATWLAASVYTFSNHAGYSASLKAEKNCAEAYEAVRKKGDDLIAILNANGAGQMWFDPKNFNAPVWYRDNAMVNLDKLEQGRKDILRDMSTHFQLQPGASPASAAAAAAAADAKAAAQGRSGSGKQSTDLPPSDSTPEVPSEFSTTQKLGLAAALAAALLWIGKKVL